VSVGKSGPALSVADLRSTCAQSPAAELAANAASLRQRMHIELLSPRRRLKGSGLGMPWLGVGGAPSNGGPEVLHTGQLCMAVWDVHEAAEMPGGSPVALQLMPAHLAFSSSAARASAAARRWFGVMCASASTRAAAAASAAALQCGDGQT
jgi:hypothetical protein